MASMSRVPLPPAPKPSTLFFSAVRRRDAPEVTTKPTFGHGERWEQRIEHQRFTSGRGPCALWRGDWGTEQPRHVLRCPR